MKNDVFQKLIYQLVSKLFVLPIYKFVFRGHLKGMENIQLSSIVTEILNFNRQRVSSLGYKLTPTDSKLESRNILV